MLSLSKQKSYDILCVLSLLIMIIVFFGDVIIGTNGLCRADSDITWGFFCNFYKIALYWRSKIFTLWDPYKFTGYTIVGNTNVGLFYPLNWPLFLLIPEIPTIGFWYYNLYIIFHFFLLSVVMYLFMRFLTGNCLSGIFSAVIFTYNAWMMSHLNHVAFICSSIWVLLSLFLLYLWNIKKRIHYLVLAAFFFSWVFLIGHGQVFLYGIYLLSFFIFYICFFSNNLQQYSLVDKVQYFIKSYITFGILTFGFTAISFFPILEFMKFNPRIAYSAKDSLVGSLPFKYIQTLIKPESFDFHHYEYDILYFGLLPIVFVILSLFWKNRLKYFFIFALVFFALLSFGENTIVSKFLYLYLPGFRMMRVPARAIIISMISISVLAGAGMDVIKQFLINRSDNKKVIAAILFILILIAYGDLFKVYSRFNRGWMTFNNRDSSLFRFIDSKLPDESPIVSRANTGFSKKMLGLFNPGECPSDQNIILTHRTLCQSSKIDGSSGLSPVSNQSHMNELLDMKYFLSPLPMDKISETLAVIEGVSASSYREGNIPEHVVDGIYLNCWLPGNTDKSDNLNEWIKIDFNRPVELKGIEIVRSKEAEEIYKVASSARISFSDGTFENFVFNRNVFLENYENIEINVIEFNDIHTTTFIKLDKINFGINEIMLDFTEDQRKALAEGVNYKKLFDIDISDCSIYQNQKVISRAYLVGQIIVEGNDEAVFSKIASGEINPREILALDKMPDKPVLLDKYSQDQYFNLVTFDRYENDIVEVSFRNDSPCYLVLTDTYYPGWVAYVDGKKTEIMKAYSFFRAVPIYEKGSHKVVFKYRPVSFLMGLSITLSTFFISIFHLLKLKKYIITKLIGYEMKNP